MSEDRSVEQIKEDLDKELKPNSFAAQVPSPLTPEQKTEVKQETLDNSVLSAQQKIVSGLSDSMTTFQIENMKNLAPKDEFEIPQGSGKIFKRRKMKPAMIKELRKAEREYTEDIKTIEDPDLRLDRDWQLLAFKANLYLGMTKEEFEETDVEYLQTIIQATELRTQGFRQY